MNLGENRYPTAAQMDAALGLTEPNHEPITFASLDTSVDRARAAYLAAAAKAGPAALAAARAVIARQEARPPMTRPRLLDLFCGAGGAAAGYDRAGFDVTGVDLRPQPRYPFAFVQADALAYLAEHGSEYAAIHASPPCQHYSQTRTRWPGREHPDLVAPTRDLLRAIGRPYVIENVPGAPLLDPVTLCGSMFALGASGRYLRRHRLFELSDPILLSPTACAHPRGVEAIGVYGHAGGVERRRGGTPRSSTDEWRAAMGIDWMTGAELSEAIPPAYTEWIGRRLLAVSAPQQTDAY